MASLPGFISSSSMGIMYCWIAGPVALAVAHCGHTICEKDNCLDDFAASATHHQSFCLEKTGFAVGASISFKPADYIFNLGVATGKIKIGTRIALGAMTQSGRGSETDHRYPVVTVLQHLPGKTAAASFAYSMADLGCRLSCYQSGRSPGSRLRAFLAVGFR